MIDTTQIQPLLDSGSVETSDGENVGKIGQVFVDDTTGNPSWVTVKTGLFGMNESFVPLAEATVSGDVVRVPYDKATIKDAPNHDADAALDPAAEQELYRYYQLDGAGGYLSPETTGVADGLADSTAATSVADSTGGAAETYGNGESEELLANSRSAGHDTSGPNTDEAMTRSEERLHVGTEQVESGRARLRKYVVTEQQTVTVPVTHEEVRLEREDITDENRDAAYSGGTITEEEHEVTLHAERPVVTTEAVAVERVRLETDTVQTEESVSGEVRKEEIELDTDGNRSADPR